MKRNMGKADRVIRVIAALVMGYLASYNVVTGNLAVVFIILSLVFFLTAIMGMCPLYRLLGINTISHKHTTAGSRQP